MDEKKKMLLADFALLLAATFWGMGFVAGDMAAKAFPTFWIMTVRFLGIAEKLDYLQEIGITTVELQPVYEFDETPEEVNKKTSADADIVATAGENGGELPGYRVLNYWGYREGFYYAPKAAYAAGEDAALEFRQLVKEFHKRRMEVILQFYFPKGMDVTEIGNILRFWVLTYHVDGFHLMGEVPAQALAGDPALTDTKLWYYDFDE